MKNIIRTIFELLPKSHFFISLRNYFSYFSHYGYFPSKKNMKYIHDYLFFLKNSSYSTKYGYFIDKHTVKKFISAFLGKNYITPTIAVFEDIEKLKEFSYPSKYVVKPTHMAGRIIIKNDGSLNKKELKSAKKWLKDNYGKISREYCYMNLNPKILIEPFISYKGEIPYDYKFFIINGKCELIQLNRDRFTDQKLHLYDRNWNIPDIEVVELASSDIIKKPHNLNEMIEIAEKIGSLFPFVRVDLYETDQGIKFGELTFIPGAGLPLFTPRDYEAELYNKMDSNHLL